MHLTRETRTWLGETTQRAEEFAGNGWSGTPCNGNLGRFVAIRITVSGDPDTKTGYVCDIRALDRLARTVVGGEINVLSRSDVATLSGLGNALTRAFAIASDQSPLTTSLHCIQLLLSPFTTLAIERGDCLMLRLTQSFEFSASHRLAIPGLSDSENRELFGKCSNPQGHGHNYVFEITVAGKANESNGTLAHIGSIDRIVREHVVDAFDHKNLNTQCPEFSDLNPTVENIASVIFNRLAREFSDCVLDRVRVWETPKTSAEVTRDNVGT